MLATLLAFDRRRAARVIGRSAKNRITTPTTISAEASRLTRNAEIIRARKLKPATVRVGQRQRRLRHPAHVGAHDLLQVAVALDALHRPRRPDEVA